MWIAFQMDSWRRSARSRLGKITNSKIRRTILFYEKTYAEFLIAWLDIFIASYTADPSSNLSHVDLLIEIILRFFHKYRAN